MTNETEKPAVDLRRRRLTKGGLAAPIVLATLASKNALAVPYQCTLSGKLSNNISPHGPKTTETCQLGNGASYWVSAVNDTTTFTSVGFFDDYYFKPTKIGNKYASTQRSGFTPATLKQILTVSTIPNTTSYHPKDLPFAKMAVVLWLNAPVSGDVYPLVKQQVVDMFNKAIQNQDYIGTTSLGSFTWTPSDVRDYFSELYF